MPQLPQTQTWWRILLLRDVPFWTASRLRRFGRLLFSFVYLVVGVLIVLLLLENSILYPAPRFSNAISAPNEDLDALEIQLPTPHGNVYAWWTVPPGWTPAKGAILFSHGNGSHLASCGFIVNLWRTHLDRAVLSYDYPGYGKSEGKPSEAGCYEAAESAYQWLQNQQVPSTEIILVGESLGAAIATEMAVRHPHRLLVLLAPFTSFPDIAQTKLPFLPVRWLVRNKLDNKAKIPNTGAPVFVAHGDADQLIPIRMGRAVYDAAGEPKRFLALPNQPHLHPDTSEFFQAVKAFLGDTEAK